MILKFEILKHYALLLIFINATVILYSNNGTGNIKNVYKNIYIDYYNSKTWNENEIKLIEKVCKSLPDEFFNTEKIYLKKTDRIKLDNNLKIDFKRKILLLPSYKLSGKNSIALIIRGLTYLFDYKYNYSESQEWRNISRWTGWDILGNHSENINPKGFVSKGAMRNPKEDFIYSVLYFFNSQSYKNTSEYLKYKIPLKYNYIRNLFKLKPDPQAGIKCVNTYKNWINPNDVEHIELLIASPSYSSIASIAGHLSLLIKRKNDIAGLSTVVSFVAHNRDKNGNIEHGLKYVSNGIMGKYKSILMEEILLELVKRQTIRENRDIYRLKLVLSRKQIDKLIRRLWSFKTNFNYKYYFFNNNCTTMLLNLINFVLDKKDKIKDFDTIDLPLHTVFKIHKTFKANFTYPEYWSLSRNAKFSYNRNIKLRKKILKLLQLITDKPDYSLIKHSFKVLISPQNKKRCDAYSLLYNTFIKLTNNNNIDYFVIAKIGKLLLEYFINAKDFEKYTYQKRLTNILKTKNKPQRFFESLEIRLILKYILGLRFINKNKYKINVQAIYDKIGKERSLFALNERQKSSYGSNYGLLSITPELLRFNDITYSSLSLKASSFLQKMGDKSVFSMGPGTELELLSLNLSISKKTTSFSKDQLFQGITYNKKFTLLKFKKIFRKSTLDYTGIMNSGISISLYSHNSDKLYMLDKTDYFSFGYILNLYERNNFENFIYLEFGSGLSKYNYYEYGKQHYLNLLVGINIKFHIFNKYSNTIIGSFSYMPKISLKDKLYNFTKISGKLETNLNLNLRKDIIITIGLKFSKKIISKNTIFNDDTMLSFFTTIRFHGKLLPSLHHIKSLFNKIF